MDETQALAQTTEKISEFERESQIFSRYLASGGGGNGFELPIAHKELPSISQKMLEWLRDLLNYFNPPQPGENTLMWIRRILEFFAKNWSLFLIAAVLVALAYLAVLIYKKVRSTGNDYVSETLHSVQQPAQELIEQIRTLTEAGEFQKAAKLRWKLFLVRQAFAASVTPREFTQLKSPPRPNDTELRDRLSVIYNLMFGKRAPEGTDFRQNFLAFDGLLSGAEKASS